MKNKYTWFNARWNNNMHKRAYQYYAKYTTDIDRTDYLAKCILHYEEGKRAENTNKTKPNISIEEIRNIINEELEKKLINKINAIPIDNDSKNNKKIQQELMLEASDEISSDIMDFLEG